MKRYIATLLIIIMTFALCACSADNEAKYCGTWTDEAETTTLVLREDGTASLRIGTEVLEIEWMAEDFDTVRLLEKEEKNTESTEGTGSTEGTESADPTEDTTVDETTEATEETVADETVESTEATEETVADETTEATEEATKAEDDIESRTLYICELKITNGYMNLMVADPNEKPVCTLVKKA